MYYYDHFLAHRGKDMTTRIRQALNLVPIILLALQLICPDIARAQFYIGAKAGIALADQKFEYSGVQFDREIGLRTGIGIGLFVDHPLAPRLGFRLEADYLQKGYKEEFTLTDEFGDIVGTDTYHARVDMLSLNLLARASLPSGTYALAGPRIDIKLGESDDFPGGAIPQELEDKYKSTIAGLTFGLGQEFKLLQKGSVFLEAQYHLDLGKLYDEPPDPDETFSLTSIENRSFAIFAGIRF